MNRSGKWVLDWTLKLVRDYHVDGIICHWNKSCGIWNSYIKRRLAGYEAADVPYTVVQADMVNPLAFDEQRIQQQLTSFIAEL